MYKKSLKIPKGVIRICQSKKDRQHNGQKKKKPKAQTMINKPLHRKLKIKQHEQHYMKIGGEFGCSGMV